MSTRMRVYERLNQVLVSWEKLRPGKSFAGMTLEEFRAAGQSAVQMKERERLLLHEHEAVQAQRIESDRQLAALIRRVVAGVKADVDEGEDGELYDAMGYVRSSQRRTGLVRKSRGETPEPPAQVAA